MYWHICNKTPYLLSLKSGVEVAATWFRMAETCCSICATPVPASTPADTSNVTWPARLATGTPVMVRFFVIHFV